MTKEKIERINFLAKKKKIEGLSEAELIEQKQLYDEYIGEYRKNLQATLGSTYIQRPNGEKERLTKK